MVDRYKARPRRGAQPHCSVHDTWVKSLIAAVAIAFVPPSAFAETATDAPYAETNVCRTRSVKGLVERVLAALMQQHVAQKLELHICGQSGPERHGRHLSLIHI